MRGTKGKAPALCRYWGLEAISSAKRYLKLSTSVFILGGWAVSSTCDTIKCVRATTDG